MINNLFIYDMVHDAKYEKNDKFVLREKAVPIDVEKLKEISTNDHLLFVLPLC